MKVRRFTGRIEVNRSGEIVPIDFRLSGDVNLCNSVQAVVVGKNLPVVSVIPCFGEYALEFEGKKFHPINFKVPYQYRSGSDTTEHNAPDLLPLHVEVKNRMVTGFYKDSGTLGEEFSPYAVRFTFNCSKA